ncbi:MAG: tripartite tricarboxylate transporter TctB family protein [Candidatus Binatia bacterium]
MASGVFGLGLFFIFEARAIPVLGTYARIGPRLFPYLVGGGLTGAGILLFWQTIGARKAADTGQQQSLSHAPKDWAAVAWITAGLIVNVILMERAGYIVSTTCLFIFAARGLGSRRYFTNVLVGFLLAVVAYLSFTRLLELHLPSGLFELFIS